MNLILGGDVTTQFTYSDPVQLEANIEAARLEQEIMCGYPLKFKTARQVQSRDDRGRDIYEVFATFAPVADATVDPEETA